MDSQLTPGPLPMAAAHASDHLPPALPGARLYGTVHGPRFLSLPVPDDQMDGVRRPPAKSSADLARANLPTSRAAFRPSKVGQAVGHKV